MQKRISRIMALVMAAILVLGLSSAAMAAYNTVVATADLNVYYQPGYNNVIGRINKGDAVVITGATYGVYSQILYGGTTNSWVDGRYLSYYSSYNQGCNIGYTTKYNQVTPKVCNTCGDTYYATTALNVRSGPGTKYSVIGSLNKNQQITAIDKSGNWIKLLTNEGRDAYASASYLKKIGSAPAASKPAAPVYGSSGGPTGTLVATTGLNVRSGPSTSYPVVYTLNRGEKVTGLGIYNGKWIKIRTTRNVEGWAHSSYLGQVVSTPVSYNPCGYGCDPCTPYAPYAPCYTAPAAVSVGRSYRPNYTTALYKSASTSSAKITDLYTDSTLTVQSVTGSAWAYVRVLGTTLTGYVPVDAIK